MRGITFQLAILVLLILQCGTVRGQQDSVPLQKSEKNAVFVEYLGKDYFSLFNTYYTINYSRQLCSYGRWTGGIAVGGILSHTKYSKERTNTFYQFLIQNSYSLVKGFSLTAETGYVYYSFERDRADAANIFSIRGGLSYNYSFLSVKVFYHYSTVINPILLYQVEAWKTNEYKGLGFSIGQKF